MTDTTVCLCTSDDISTNPRYMQLPIDDITDEQAAEIVAAIGATFQGFLDQRPAAPFCDFSQRALNVMNRYNVHTVAELKVLLVRAKGKQGIYGAGRLVMADWQKALDAAAGRLRVV